MTSQWTELVQATPQIIELLRSMDTDLEYTVSARWPREKITGTIITVTEITNQISNIVADTLAWQIDLWSPRADDVRELSPLVNAALCGLGLRRDYGGPEEQTESYIRRTFRFGRRVDKRTMRLVD